MKGLVLLLGAPGVGKGTYGARLAAAFRCPFIGTGDIVRDEIKKESHLGLKFQQYSNAGTLVPSNLIADMMIGYIKGRQGEGMILDGFPRSIAQAHLMEKELSLDMVVCLSLKREEYLVSKILGRRICSCGKSFNVANLENETEGVKMPPLLPAHGDPLKCECGKPLNRRADDTELIVKKRLDVYKKETEPLISHYLLQKKLHHFEILRGLDDLPKLEKLIVENTK